jgi:hypothetical protein
MTELTDLSYSHKCIKELLETLVPGFSLPINWRFTVHTLDDGSSYVVTDLDFDAINIEYHKNISKEHSSIMPEYLLCHSLDARVDTDLAAEYMAELIVKPQISSLIRIRFERLLARRDVSEREIGLFQEVHLGGFHAIREAINSGERTFSEFMPVLNKAHRFKAWLAGKNPDASLLKEYYDEATTETWINKLPVKGLRYVISTLTGIINLPAGLAMSAGDEFLVERLLRGWRPNQFVEGPLRKFVSTS